MKYITAFLLLIAVHAQANIQTLDWDINDTCDTAQSSWTALSNGVRVRAIAHYNQSSTMMLAGFLLEAPAGKVWTSASNSVQNINKQNINMWESQLDDKRYKIMWPVSTDGNAYIFQQLGKSSALRIMNNDGSYVRISARGAIASISQLGACKAL